MGAGNPTTVRSTTGQTYNSDNQHTNSPTTWDGNGNMTTAGGGQPATYDAESRLTTYNTSTETNTYFADGLRATMHTSAGTTYFLYDAGVPVCELNSSGTVTAYNTWGPYGLVSRDAGGSTYFYGFDEQGNTAQIYTSSMGLDYQYLYDAYGNQQGGSSAIYAYDGFGSKWGNYHDPGIGWTLMGHRFMAPGQTRFVNRDPMGYAGGINLYRYVDNNPINEIDPAGLWPPGNGDDDDGGFGSDRYGAIDDYFNNPSGDTMWSNFVTNMGNWTMDAEAAGGFLTDAPELPEMAAPWVVREAGPIAEDVDSIIQNLNAEAEKLYSSKIGKFEDHHVTPQYLGGPKNGPKVRIPAAYHQLVTNEFRRLAPYGKDMVRPCEEDLEKLMKAVYSKYPLPKGTSGSL